MARVTVEDCIDKVHDRFELVALAAQRAKNITAGEALTIDPKGEKNTVVALREIAHGSVAAEGLRESLTRFFQKEHQEEDKPVDDASVIPEELGMRESFSEMVTQQMLHEKEEEESGDGLDLDLSGENVEAED